MSTEPQPTPREELEMRITALLMGELAPEEAATLQAQIAADPELAKLHARLAKAKELLHEATALPEQPLSEIPVQLSSERRERLLAYCKTPAPASASPIVTVPISQKPRREWGWVVQLSLAAAVVAFLGLSTLLPPTSRLRSKLPLIAWHKGDASESDWAFKKTPVDVSAYAMKIPAAESEFTVTSSMTLPPPPPGQTAKPSLTFAKSGAGTWNLASSLPGAQTATAHPSPPIYLGTFGDTSQFSNESDWRESEKQKSPFATDVAGSSSTVTLNGGNILTLTGSNTYTGGTAISGGTLLTTNAGGSFAAGTGGTLSHEATTMRGGGLSYGTGLPDGYGTVPSGSGTVDLHGTVDLNGTSNAISTPSSTTALNRPPTVSFDDNISVPSPVMTRDIEVTAGKSFTVGNSFAVTGSGAITKIGAGTLSLTGGASNSLAASPAMPAAGATGNITLSGVIAGNAGTPIISDANSSVLSVEDDVSRLAITGATRTKDKLIRRPLPAQPADDFATATIAGSGGVVKIGNGTLSVGQSVTGNVLTFGGTGESLALSSGGVIQSAPAATLSPTSDGGNITVNGSNLADLPNLGMVQLLQNEFQRDPRQPAAPASPQSPQPSDPRFAGRMDAPVAGQIAATAKPASTPESVVNAPEQQNRVVQLERTRGAADPTRAAQMKKAGDAAMKEKDYEKAAALYKAATDLTPNTAATQSEHKETLQKFSEASTKLAEQRITEGRYTDAENAARGVLDERYDPKNKKAVTLLSRLEQPDYYNKAASPKFRANVEQVKQWFVEAQGFYDTGRLDLAKKRAEQILNIDPTNVAARKFEEKTDRALSDYGVAAYNETRADAIAKTDMAWTRPVRRNRQNEIVVETTSPQATADKLQHKLEHIIIPKIDFRNVTVREAIDFLKKKSVEVDDFSPAGERGTNIVLKLADAGSASAKAPSSIPPIPGLEEAAPQGTPATKTGSNPADTRITVSLTNIPLVEALKYVTGLANLTYKVEPYAVAIMPMSENTDVFITKEWTIPKDLIPSAPDASPNTPIDRDTVKNWLIANGLTFNGNASALYIKSTNRLVIRNTQDQLDLVDRIVKADAKEREDKAKETVPTAPIPQPEVQTSANAFSTFSLNVSDVSFKLAAASLEQGHMPDPASVRSEEFINAFDYRDPEPSPGAPLAFVTERARYPFAQNRDLLRFAVKTAAAGRQPGRPLNIVLLLDRSGSMERADRVNIVREALSVLAKHLQPQDKLSIVTFARTPHLWADAVAGDKVHDVIARVNEITPEGGTNLEAALDLAYETAHHHFAVDSTNRVILFTDGAANLGDVNPDALTKKVEAQRKQGIALDCFGIGWEGYNDDLLEQLTRNADGRYGFINTPEDAAANFATQIAGALQVAASDVKVQVEFNPHRVKTYRQIGYATHQLTKEQFRDNSVNAAQIGAAESGNALYVVEVDPHGEGDLATVHVRFRVPGTSDYREHEWPVPFAGEVPPLEQASSALRLAGAASAFSEMLAASPYATEVTSDRLLNILNGVPPIYGADPRPTKLEWMIRQARSLSGR
ncbi:autotransporter-associated beta strand repeat protein [Chthoniobacter flavus Ellin428]|uniref:Autotransporter-associated beta strand repeat protein n=1 Tax=Chthoniobacter flavus Ellin428 TaxID=497964 RepID=B4D1N7_9BACT|nr:von Willebrand factor type A domain-containing protein [Chthoniobacter flavus]EDY19649.1 autotransporter-associated beta strand repeat protein [Chthoniobacter flavus Ellin428]